MNIISRIILAVRDRCWHDWYEHAECGRDTIAGIASEEALPFYINKWEYYSPFLSYHQSVCLKCGKCIDTISPAIDEMKKTLAKRRDKYLAARDRDILGQKLWRDRCGTVSDKSP